MTCGLFSSLRCFERFFRGVNVKEGKLVAKRRAYLMEDLNLIGVDYLWQVTTVVSTTTTAIFICTHSLVQQEINTMQLLKVNLEYLLRGITIGASGARQPVYCLTFACCGWQEEPAILTSRLLLWMHGMYITSFIWVFYHWWSDQTWFWPSITRNLCKAQRWTKNVLTFQSLSPALLNLEFLLVIAFIA